MSDVAERAGVSLKSVSRVVNGERHVRPELAARVQRAVAELGYLPDRRARDLAARPSSGRLIGFVQVDAGNPFFAAVYRGLEDVTRERGFVIIAGSTDADPAREAALVGTLAEFRVEGLVIAAAEGQDDVLRREIDRGTPVVCVDRVLPDLCCDTVVSSNRDSTRAAVRHLRDTGHRRIAFLGGDQAVWTAAERRAGYREALEASGIEVDPDLEVLDVDDVERAASATRKLLAGAAPPTALFTAQDRITAGAVTALHDLGRQHDIALFGYDDIPFSAQLSPSVAVAAQDPYEMGRRAAGLLLDRLAGTGPAQPVRSVVPAPLRHRESGSIRPTS
ncbi:MAG TPA: LacI family DNA-binding transcriptional regulator [Euzebyales bacterium]|nr:LacI family DNA-binding transcriptional regulator [Euzebyales bacterium]